MLAEGTNGSVELHDHHIVISRGGVRNALRGLGGVKSIPLSSITAIQFRTGSIQFSVLGEIRKPNTDIRKDENAVMFNRSQFDQFEVMKNAIQNAINIPSLAGVASQHARSRDVGSPSSEIEGDGVTGSVKRLKSSAAGATDAQPIFGADGTEPRKPRTFSQWLGDRHPITIIVMLAAIGIALITFARSGGGDTSAADTTEVAAENGAEGKLSALDAMGPEEQRNAAFAAAFSADEAPHFTPAALVDVGDHKAIVAVRQTPADASHADSGALSVRYVDWDGSNFASTDIPPLLEETGSSGAIGGWKVRRDLGKYPVIVLEGGGTWQGCTIAVATLIELRPDKPMTLGSIPSFRDFPANDFGGDGRHYTGTLSRDRTGFKMRYRGSVNMTVHLARNGAKLKPDHELPGGC
jgi:hypothetical protein